jgi:hypothetical protein
MGDDSTPLHSRLEAGDDAHRASGDGDDGDIGDGGAELPEVLIANVVGEEAANAEKESAADQ